ncbi:HlyD family efflux transporter periplasmic adaptor subunit [Nocardioides yefusunii]|uniref:HlyD family efflux transporter periplasmic adaptor subunit n=1 Tax=Nocardioides yefusunii TaxID=2500546 RepID=A0ABW1R132_9ACTN|nr:HlyD family efflux transporter periplasmic adaptor subunit [Nocardioides yefusunii]
MADALEGLDEQAPRSRRRALVLLVSLTVLSTAVSLGAMRLVRSPAQEAADAAPPPRSVLSAEVVRQEVSDEIVARGTVKVPRRTAVAPEAPAGAARAVVTELEVGSGDRVRSGQMLLEVSGRPVFVLEGKVPMFREIRRGDQGRDVRQLQQALAALGHRNTDAVGVFGPSTQAAVTRWYAAAGHTPVGSLEVAAAAGDAPVADAGRTPARDGDGEEGDASAEVVRDPAVVLREQMAAAVTVPMAEVVFVPRLPSRVSAVRVKVGSTLSGSALTLSDTAPVVVAQLNPADAALVEVGQRADLTDPGTGKNVAGTVVRVGAAVRDASGGLSVPVRIEPDDRLAFGLAGTEFQVSVVKSAGAAAALAVPLSALTTSANGETSVSVLSQDGSQRRVKVRAGVVGGGFVEVAGDLAAGQRVVVGEGRVS